MISLLVITFFAVVATGPDGVEWMCARRARRDRPSARVSYLPSACCRSGAEDPTLALVRERRQSERPGIG